MSFEILYVDTIPTDDSLHSNCDENRLLVVYSYTHPQSWNKEATFGKVGEAKASVENKWSKHYKN